MDWLLIERIIAIDRRHEVSRNRDILQCETGVLSLCPHTITCKNGDRLMSSAPQKHS